MRSLRRWLLLCDERTVCVCGFPLRYWFVLAVWRRKLFKLFSGQLPSFDRFHELHFLPRRPVWTRVKLGILPYLPCGLVLHDRIVFDFVMCVGRVCFGRILVVL